MKRILLILLLVLAPAVFAAQNQNGPRSRNGNGLTGFRAEALANVIEVQDKILQLAEAVPASKYTWRPAPGVRSMSEVFMHIAGGNYFLATFLGKQPPADIPQDLEKVTDKQKVLAELRKSFEYLRTIINTEPDADLEKAVKVFGSPSTHRGVLLTAVSHLHEHLGQAIAYARMNDIVPPWSR